jgi:hypothetical protein
LDEWVKQNPTLRQKTESRRLTVKMLPEVTEELFEKIYKATPWNLRGIKSVKPLPDFKLAIVWTDGLTDTLDVERAFSRTKDLSKLRGKKAFDKVKPSAGGNHVKFPVKGFKFPADRIWIDCRLQDMYPE